MDYFYTFAIVLALSVGDERPTLSLRGLSFLHNSGDNSSVSKRNATATATTTTTTATDSKRVACIGRRRLREARTFQG